MLAIGKQSVCALCSLVTKMQYFVLKYILNTLVMSLFFFKKTEKLNGKWKPILLCNNMLYIITVLLFHRESELQ